MLSPVQVPMRVVKPGFALRCLALQCDGHTVLCVCSMLRWSARYLGLFRLHLVKCYLHREWIDC